MQKEKSLCHQCKCLDTTSLTDSGLVCLVGEDIDKANICNQLLRKKPTVRALIVCVETLNVNESINAVANENYVIRLFPDGSEKVTSSDNEEPICDVNSNDFNRHFKPRDLSQLKWVMLNDKGEQGLHKPCGSPVHEDSSMSRFCIDKSCTGSFYGIDIMEELVRN